MGRDVTPLERREDMNVADFRLAMFLAASKGTEESCESGGMSRSVGRRGRGGEDEGLIVDCEHESRGILTTSFEESEEGGERVEGSVREVVVHLRMGDEEFVQSLSMYRGLSTRISSRRVTIQRVHSQ